MGPGMFDGLAELAMIGLIAIVILMPFGIIGLIMSLWWLWHHVVIV